MIKKVISFSFILLIIFLGYQFAINYLKTEHSVTYIVKDYNIAEDFVTDEESFYIIQVTDPSGNNFVFREKNNYNKQKEIVKDVITYTGDDVTCMSLKYISSKEMAEPICLKDGALYSYIEISI